MTLLTHPLGPCLYSLAASIRATIFRAMSQECPADITTKTKYSRKGVSRRKFIYGRPSKYVPGTVNRIMEFFMLNANGTETQLADFLGIDVTTLQRYAKLYPRVADAISRGKMHLTAKVARSLFERAFGYDVIERKVTKKVVLNDNFEQEEIIEEIVEYHRHIPGSDRAALAILRNRDDNWKEKGEVEKFEKDKELIAELLGINQEDLPE